MNGYYDLRCLMRVLLSRVLLYSVQQSEFLFVMDCLTDEYPMVSFVTFQKEVVSLLFR